MRCRALGRLTLAAVVGAVSAGCRRPPPATSAAPVAWPPEDHCWWAAFRTLLSPDSVAVRSARAYDALGLTGARWAHRADTAWAEAGPTALAGRGRRGAVYAARVVAYRRGDSTYFRPFVSVTRRPDAAPADSAPLRGQHIAFCGETGRATQAHGTAPRAEEPDDSLPVWRRRP